MCQWGNGNLNHSKKSVIFYLAILLSLNLINISMMSVPVKADIFFYDDTNMMGIVTSNPNISMPEAYVYVDAVVTSNWNYNFEINCSYIVRSNSTCNVTIAFVYPMYYSDDYVSPEEGPLLGEYNLSIDNVPVYHETKTWDEMPSEIQSVFSWHNDALTFEIFNMTLEENRTSEIRIYGEFEYSTIYSLFSFSYMVETARWWAGNTKEIVVMDVDIQTTIESIHFTPDSYLSLSVNGSRHIGEWNFTIDEFPSDYAPGFEIEHFSHSQYHYPTTTTPESPISTIPSSPSSTTSPTMDNANLVFIIGIIGGSAIILIVAIAYLLRKR